MKKYKKLLDKKQYKEMLEDLCIDECSEKNDCTLKEFLIHLHPSPRLLMQIKCVKKFKEKMGEIEWNEAMERWDAEGYAEKFSKIYKEGMKFTDIYKKLIS